MTKQQAGRATVIYARISQDHAGTEAGVSDQVADSRALAERLGLTVDGTPLVDNNITADERKRRRRPQYEALMARVAAGEVGVIICHSFSRLWRGRRDRADAVELLQRHGVTIHCVKGPSADLSQAAGRLVLDLLGSADLFELDQIKERQQRAMLRRVLNGDPPSGPRAYGYAADGRTPVDDEAAVVRWLFEQFNAGASLSGLAADLNRRGVPNRRGTAWTHNAVRHVLGSERYAALRTYQGRTYPGTWPALVTEAVVRASQARLAHPDRKTSPGPASVHLLTGIATCGAPSGDGGGVCGRAVTSGSRGAGHPVYLCGTGPHGKHLARAAPSVNAYVESVLIARLAAADVAALLVPDDSDELAQVQREAVALRAKLEGLAALLADPQGGMDPVDYQAAVRAVRGALAAAEAKLSDSARGSVLAPFATGRDPRDVWAGLGLDRRRAVVALLLDVRLEPAAGFSKRRFDPRSVTVGWKGGPVVVVSDRTVTVDGLSDDVAREVAEAVRRGGWDVTRDGGCVTVPADAEATARDVAEFLVRWDVHLVTTGALAAREAVRSAVGRAPVLTADQRDRLAGLLGAALRPSDGRSG